MKIKDLPLSSLFIIIQARMILNITKEIFDAGKLIGIEVLGHVIIGGNKI